MGLTCITRRCLAHSKHYTDSPVVNDGLQTQRYEGVKKVLRGGDVEGQPITPMCVAYWCRQIYRAVIRLCTLGVQ
jgi:hypothetical protein